MITQTSVNFLQVVEPTHRIVIGIKDGEIVSMDWGTLFLGKEPKDYRKTLTKYLNKTIKYLKQNPQK